MKLPLTDCWSGKISFTVECLHYWLFYLHNILQEWMNDYFDWLIGCEDDYLSNVDDKKGFIRDELGLFYY